MGVPKVPCGLAVMVGVLLAVPAAGATPPPPVDWNIADTGQPSRYIEVDTREGTWISLDVNPDGSQIVFDLLGDIFVMPSAGGEARLVHGGPAMQHMPRFSPDGRSIGYMSDASGNTNIWTSSPDGTSARQVSYEERDILSMPAFSPDGELIAATRTGSRFPDRWTSTIDFFPLDGKGDSETVVEIPQNRRDVTEAAFAPDGRHLYYTERVNAPNIYIDGNHVNNVVRRRDLTNGQTREVAGSFGSALAPVVSPDGKQLAFVRRVRAKTVLFVLDLASGQETPVFDGLDRDLQTAYEIQGNYYPHYAWFPDGRTIAIWAGGRILRIDTRTGTAQDIPFHVRATHKIVDPLRTRIDLAPVDFTVRATRQVASDDRGGIVFTALGTLWHQPRGGATQTLLGKGHNAFDPAFGPDGKALVYVVWDDETGSRVELRRNAGDKGVVIATSPGIIREPHLSPDMATLVFRLQSPDPLMGGGRERAGIYTVPVKGGEKRFVIEGNGAPMFSPDGARIFYMEKDLSGNSSAQVIKSVNRDGFDKREHLRAKDSDTVEIRLSPTLDNVAFKHQQQYFVMPFRQIGRPLVIDLAAQVWPLRRLTSVGGYGLSWSPSGGSVHWLLGGEVFARSLADETTDQRKLGLRARADVPTGTVAFVDGTVLTMRDNERIEHGTVIVHGNRIVAVGPTSQVKVPDGAHVVDARGKTVMPGFIDAHGHLDCCWMTGVSPTKKPALFAALAFGVTTVFDPYPNELISYEQTEMTLAGLNTGPRWIGTGAAVWGRPAQSSSFYEPLDTIADAAALMQRKAALGGTIVKSYRIPSRASRQMLVKAAREAGIMVDAEGESHFYNDITMIEDGHTNLEHNIPVSTYYDDLVQLMAKAGAHTTPTLVVTFGELMGENFMYQNTSAWNDPRVKSFQQEILSGYSPLGAPYGAPYYVRAMTSIHAADEIYDIGFRSVARSMKRLDDAGVIVNAGSHGEVPGLSQHWEMALLAQGGLEPWRVLRTATVNPANTLGIADQVGTLEVGKLADIIVLEKDPLEAIDNTLSVSLTMVNGRLYDTHSMDQVGNHPQKRSRFYWEVPGNNGVDWNESAARR